MGIGRLNVIGFSALFALGAGQLRAQEPVVLAPHVGFPISVSSGEIANESGDTVVLFALPVHVPGAAWMRIAFGADTRLPAVGLSPDSRAFIRITSAFDGAVQTLDRRTLSQWKGRSAYFNGDTVLVELVSPAGAGICHVEIAEALIDTDLGVPRDSCGPSDDRVPSNDPRVARLLPIGCTAWLIHDVNKCFLTAGHCAAGDGASMDVVEFNVPLSTSTGSLLHPPPADQYAVDLVSLQRTTTTIAIGNDWCYFGVFDNSTTGMTAFESQGSAFHLVTTPPVAAGQTIRKTGFGTTDPPVPNQWNQAQKTLAGPFGSIDGTKLHYAIDSSGGDSGSPVFNESDNVAFAIHTNGGCSSSGSNHGCSVLHPDLQAALANPLGVCVPRYFNISFPVGRPSTIDPLGGTPLVVQVAGRNDHEANAAGVYMHVDTGGGFIPYQMEKTGPEEFTGYFPPAECTTSPRYYVSAGAMSGANEFNPPTAPGETYLVVAASSVATLASFDFETAGGWTVQNIDVVDGAWGRGIPVGDGTRGDPPEDFDGSGQCWLTGNQPGDSDVDGGPTRLWSPAVNLAAATRPMISYAYWFTNDTGEDVLSVELSNNFGVNWSEVATYSNFAGWRQRVLRVADFIVPTNITRIRFSTADNPNNSRTESAIDAVHIFDALCPAMGECRKGDITQDGRIDARDVDGLVQILTSGGEPGTPSYCAADMNENGGVALDDVPPFIDCAVLGLCP